MNSPIKLPPLPYPQIPGNDYTAADMRAYAEQAVREALAAQLPVAWMLDVRKGMSDPLLCWGNPDGIYASTYLPLALIPDNNHTPTECGACSGTGRVVRDPDIGTDQECWVCNGSGHHE